MEEKKRWSTCCDLPRRISGTLPQALHDEPKGFNLTQAPKHIIVTILIAVVVIIIIMIMWVELHAHRVKVA